MSESHAGLEDRCRVALVDDDTAVLRALSRLLTLCGYETTTFSSAESFLASLESELPDVILLDLRMPGLDGLQLQEELIARGIRVPTVFLSGHGDVTSSVRALRNGAIDFLEKPCDEPVLLAALARAVNFHRSQHQRMVALREAAQRARTLTPREREVFRLVVEGRLNKQIAAALGTSEKTIKVHRARVMTKMHAESVADLVRIFDLLAAGEQTSLDFRADGPRPNPRSASRPNEADRREAPDSL
jgi:FixJ family two-component response regulator